ncbi:hypothetical protein SAMN00120144_2267 [Hymenobacter roseosalivarius DSM 11622]|uniref:Uncharacterized protein n=1 Tax=Hymenobacter roseosalivarius DSM 11622 TaxID=645990 RepID=A0A1W1VXT1_9BACT|nr:hypothetical protein SAMN00120144_2267 [Hymenobacter roseosalivarius DSM 11622]
MQYLLHSYVLIALFHHLALQRFALPIRQQVLPNPERKRSRGGDIDGNLDANTTFPKQMLVDYVRYYQYK